MLARDVLGEIGVKAVSIRQPWAELIIRGCKTLELRSWPINYRGPLLIHAGKTIDRVAAQVLNFDVNACVIGALIGVATVSDCRRFTEQDADILRRHGAYFGPWVPGLYAWELRDVRRIRPRSWPGSLGLFEVPDEVGLELKS